MLELATDPALVERLGRAGRRFAESLTWDHAADLTESHLRELASR
jgi:glycosyltransferase involved in cell wall biosynthesis